MTTSNDCNDRDHTPTFAPADSRNGLVAGLAADNLRLRREAELLRKENEQLRLRVGELEHRTRVFNDLRC